MLKEIWGKQIEQTRKTEIRKVNFWPESKHTELYLDNFEVLNKKEDSFEVLNAKAGKTWTLSGALKKETLIALQSQQMGLEFSHPRCEAAGIEPKKEINTLHKF